MNELWSLLFAVMGGVLLGYMFGWWVGRMSNVHIMRIQSDTIKSLTSRLAQLTREYTDRGNLIKEWEEKYTEVVLELHERNRWIIEEVNPILDGLLNVYVEKGGETGSAE